MYKVWFAAAALALGASEAWAAEENMLIYTKGIDEKAGRAALPAGSPSVEVKLDCLAAVGRFESCVVMEGAEPGSPVAAAAIKLSLTQRFNPKDKNGAPAAGRRFVDYVPMMAPGDRDPDWLRKPTPETIAAVLPVRAVREGKSGSARIVCRVTVEGFLDRCKVLSEKPEGYDFGAAALQLSQQFRMTPKLRGGRPVEGEVRIPIDWSGMPQLSGPIPKERILADPNWKSAPSAAAVKAAYPAKAAGVPSGQAALRCELTDTGQATRCDVTSEIPSGLGFAAAAKALSPNFVIAFAPENAAVLKDLKVDIPFRFRNPTAPDDGRLTEPRWTTTLSQAGADRLFPAPARAEKIWSGVGTVNCAAAADGSLVDCRQVGETPTGKGFGPAALEAAKLMQMNLWTKSGDAIEGRRLTLPFRFQAPAPPEAPAAAPATTP